MTRFRTAWLTACIAVVVARPLRAAVDDQQVLDTIEQIKAYLYNRQDRATGNWEFRSRSGGLMRDRVQVGSETAMVVLALLVSGEPAQNPKIQRALDYLEHVDARGTYARSIRAQVWANLPPRYLPNLRADAGWLIDAAAKHEQLLFDYQSVRSSYVDNSVTQYGILGLWEASKRGVRIPPRYWQRWADHFLEAQQPDGSWIYSASRDQSIGGVGSGNVFDAPGTGAATTTGLTTLLIAQQEMLRDRKSPQPQVAGAIHKGMQWLDANFDLAAGGGGYNHYYLYNVERVASANGVRYLNNLDWYKAGAQEVVRDLGTIEGTSHDVIQMAFALMFLSRGRYPLWVTKLSVPELRCDNHPADMYYATLFVSGLQEAEVNWQAMSIDSDPADWLAAPAAFLASDQALNLDAQQKANLKRFIDLGGLLITSPDNNSRAFRDSVQNLARELYPQYAATQVTPTNLLLRAWQHVPEDKPVPMSAVHNGARPLIVMMDEDWGYTLQSENDLATTDAGNILANLFAFATDKGVLSNRLATPVVTRQDRPTTGRFTVARPRYEGNWLPEPLAWSVEGNYIFNHTGMDVAATPSDPGQALLLDHLGDCPHKLAHLTGTEAVDLTDAQLTAITRYVNRGGTLLVETVGGHGQFAQSVLDQLTPRLNASAIPLTERDPIVSGEGLSGGANNRRTLYRRYVAANDRIRPAPDLLAVFLGDDNPRPAVIVSNRDLSLGMLGSRQWAILGYEPDSARDLVTNILLWAAQQQLAPAADHPFN